MSKLPKTEKEWLGEDNQIGLRIYENKYRYNSETFEQFIDRVSGGDKEVAELILQKRFIPAGRILAGRGVKKLDPEVKLSYPNCYVVEPPRDNLESIFKTAGELARIYSYGGGAGIDISGLSPAGAHIRNAAKTTSGAVSFIDLYAIVTKLIGQKGRRGAMMISLDCTHPDLPEFIKLKTDLNKSTSANLSIRVNKDFMDAVKYNGEWTMSFTRKETGETVSHTMKARDILLLFAETNSRTGEPGILFWDNIESYNMLQYVPDFHYAGVNPCAEEPLPAAGSCLLGSVNLAEFVNYPFTEHACLNKDDLAYTIRKAVDAMNDILDESINLHPLDSQRVMASDWRQIGLGIMGYAEMLLKKNIRYGSQRCIDFTDDLGRFIAKEAIEESIRLVEEKGNFPELKRHPEWKELIADSDFIRHNVSDVTRMEIRKKGIRNSQILTIAPTGSISTMFGVSSGVEPFFDFNYTMKTESLDGRESYYSVEMPIVKQMRKVTKWDKDELPENFVKATEIPFKERIDVQAAWQRHIDASISSTCNLPNSSTVKDIEQLYLYAHDKHLKGITVFREGCERAAVLTSGKTEKKADAAEKNEISELRDSVNDKTAETIVDAEMKKEPNQDDICEHLIGLRRKLHTGCGNLHLIAMFREDTGKLYEIFLSKGSTGGCNSFMNALSRFISKGAQKGMTIEEICDQLDSSVACTSYCSRTATKHDTSKGTSCPSAVGNALRELYQDMQERICRGKKDIAETKSEEKIPAASGQTCPVCGMPLIFEGGCNICKNCGWSRCF